MRDSLGQIYINAFLQLSEDDKNALSNANIEFPQHVDTEIRYVQQVLV
ncbi:hypothetical protein [Halalkalibacter okhensis]|nr:hypothetical protein [Halalkalibacter okhensis]